MDDGYLKDEELDKIISEIENGDMVKPPDELCDRVLACISEGGCLVDQKEDSPKAVPADKRTENRLKKQKEYRRYRWRVWTAAAASLAILFLLPSNTPRPVPKAPSVVEREREAARMERLQKLSGVLEDILRLQDGGREE